MATAVFPRALQDEVVAEIGPLFVDNALGSDFPALIVGIYVVKLTLLAAAKIPAAMRACISPAHFPFDVEFFSTKNAVHDAHSSCI